MRRLHLLLLLLLSACATGPSFDTSRVNRSLTPGTAVAKLPSAEGKQVLWGGVIISTTNLKDSTHIEVLSYPLDSNDKPRSEQQPLGRFILKAKGFLEPATYAKDRMVTAVGTLAGSQPGKVGESDYVYPVIAAEQLYLWPKPGDRDATRVYFGIGVGF
jgi:outer membrane lipoprotein